MNSARHERPPGGGRRAGRRPVPAAAVAVAVIVALLASAAGLALARDRARDQPAVRWRRTWSASFAGPPGAGLPAGRGWQYETGRGIFGNNDVQVMTAAPANVHLDGHGALDLTALWVNGWTSGEVETARRFAAPPGGELRVTAKIEQPGARPGLGYWPAFWLLGQGAWPAHGEIDILEDVNGLSAHSGALHCGNLTARNADGTTGPCHEYTGLSSGLRPCPGCQAGYHRYTVVIDRRDPGGQQVRWYLDGREFFSVAERQVGAAAWTEAVDHGFAIVLDLAMGGSYPDGQCRCTAPDSATAGGGTLSVRSVSVYAGRPG